MFPLLLGTQQIWDIKEGENADNLGPMAWLFLQENVQVQYLQKIALRAENPFRPKWSHYLDMLYFPHVVRFSVAIEATIFRIERRAIEAQCLQSIFTFLSIFLYRRRFSFHLII